MAIENLDFPSTRGIGFPNVRRWVGEWLRRRRDKQHLRLAIERMSELSPHLLSDIGLTNDAVGPVPEKPVFAGRT